MNEQISNMPQPGDLFDLEVSDLAVEGGGVARHDSLVFFLDSGLPGDLVRVEVEEVKPRFVRARVKEILRPSPDRVTPFCPHFGECGGCAWQNFDYKAQLRWKERHLRETLRRVGKVQSPTGLAALESLRVEPSPAQRAYRNKMEYVFGQDAGNALFLGFKRRASHAVLPIESCPLQSDAAAAILAAVRAWAKRHAISAPTSFAVPAPGQPLFLIIRESLCKAAIAEQGNSGDLAVELITLSGQGGRPDSGQVRELARDLLALGVSSFTHSARRAKSGPAIGDRVLFHQGADHICDEFAGLRLCALPGSFMQTNTAAAGILCAKTAELFALAAAGLPNAPAPVECVWDLYCGAGLFALHMSGQAVKVVGFEQDRQAVRSAIYNATTLGVANCRFQEGDVLEKCSTERTHPQIVIMDPPRAGLDPAIIRLLKGKNPAGLIYVSCAPGALARDLARLAPEYQLLGVRAVDMFPHTPHVEVGALLGKG